MEERKISRVPQYQMYDDVLKSPPFQKPDNYSSYHDGKVNKQIRVRIRKRKDGQEA